MAKAAPSKKTAKAAKTASTGGKKKAHRKGKETFNSYIHKVLKQVHPGALGVFTRPALWRRGWPARSAPLKPLAPWVPLWGMGGRGRAGPAAALCAGAFRARRLPPRHAPPPRGPR